MDHIPNIQCPAHEHIRVPYLFREDWGYKYDNRGFFFFPERQGWDPGTILERNFNLNGREEPLRAASFLQAWLYFGFMSEVLNTEILTNDFIEEIDGQDVITTNSLQRYIDNWQDEVAGLPEDVKEKRLQSILTLFRDADLYFKSATQNPPGEPPSPLPPEGQLSLSVLHATLVFATMHIFRDDDDPSPSNIAEFVPGFPVDLVKTLLRDQHWCPSDIALLEQGGLGSSSPLELYYAYLLGNKSVIRDHSGCESSFAGRFACGALNVSDDQYEPEHVTGCQRDCGFIEVDQDWLAKVTRASHFPLITISLHDSGSTYLENHESDITTRYIAISHVYADGLGNPRICGLPACQLKRVQSRVNLLDPQRKLVGTDSENIPFWMDTLCIPKRRDLGHVKKAALRSMADIYWRAQAVLVLNAELEDHSCHASREEILMRISTSAWFRRLWTLQEGVLAPNLYFQFQDGAVKIESLESPYKDHRQRFSVTRRLQAQAIKPYARIRAFRDMAREQRIREIYPLIQWRTTTKNEDEPYCLSTLLLADEDVVHNITATNDFDKRMEEFILGQRIFPVKALFFLEPRAGTREPPIGWALRSYLFRLEPEAVPNSDPLAPVDIEGWHVNLCGITFPAPNLPVNPVQDRLPDFSFTAESEATRLEISFCSWLRDQNPPQLWTDICPAFGASKLGIVFEKWPLDCQERYPGSKSFSPTRGAIIAITEETEDKFTGFFCGTVVVSKLPEAVRRNSPAILLDSLSGFDTSLLEAVLSPRDDFFPDSFSGYDASLLEAAHSPGDNFSGKEGLVLGQHFDAAREWCIK